MEVNPFNEIPLIFHGDCGSDDENTGYFMKYVKYHETDVSGMPTLVVPLFGDSPAMISELTPQISPNRIILCHTSSESDSAHHNAQKLKFHLENRFRTLDEISVIPLGCSEHPLSLGEAFSRMIVNHNEGLPDEEKSEYHTLITQEAPVGYFFGLTMLSILNPVRVYCYMSYTNLDISRTHPIDFSGDIREYRSIRRIPLFDQFDESKEWLRTKPGSTKVFEYLVGWYNEDRIRYKENRYFGSSTLVDFASRMKKEKVQQSTISAQITKLLDMPEEIRLIEKNENKSREYRITPLGRSVGWIMGLTNEYPEIGE